MATKQIIGIVGKKGVGKSTVANYICNNRNTKEFTFSHNMKSFLSTVYHIPIENFIDNNLKEVKIDKLGTTPRRLMQIFGMAMREFQEKYIPELRINNPWLHNVKEKIIEDFDQKVDIVIISDIRFPDELDMIKSMGATVIEIIRNVIINDYSNHISETSLGSIDVDFIINNNGTKEELYSKIDNILANLSK